jgi:hypothetical protein
MDDYWDAVAEARECKAEDSCVIVGENARCVCPVAVNAAAAEGIEAMGQALECDYDIGCLIPADDPRCEEGMCVW